MSNITEKPIGFVFPADDDKSTLIRYSAIIAHLKGEGDHDLCARILKDLRSIPHSCDNHGLLLDPIVGVDVVRTCLVVACPWCSGEAVRKMWEDQKVENPETLEEVH